MNLFHKTKPVEIFLNRNLERSIYDGHPWVYADSLRPPLPSSGSFAVLRNKKGNTVAKGIYDPESPLAFRVCVAGSAPLDDAWVEDKLEKALARRMGILNEETDACRLVFGEGDSLPGLVCDLYHDVLVFQMDGKGPARFWNAAAIARWFSQRIKLRTAYLKYRPGEKTRGEILWGEKDLKKALIKENGVRFKVDVVNGQKTGFFLDQRENRLRIRSLSRDKSVLNLFGYTGGFSVYAGMGGAAHVETVDIAKSAVAEAHQNWILNQLPESAHAPVAANVFEFLEEAVAKKKGYDVVIADPPSFASSGKEVEKAKAAYIKLLSLSARVLNKEGILAASSCSSHIDNDIFYQICVESLSTARRRGRVLGFFNQPPDHPYPLACPELCYLKFALIEVE